MQIETLYYHGTLYTWHHEPQNEYHSRHISIASAVHMINRDDSIIIEQDEFYPPRYKYFGHGHAGIITVIMEGDHIVTTWNSSTEEVKMWLNEKGESSHG